MRYQAIRKEVIYLSRTLSGVNVTAKFLGWDRNRYDNSLINPLKLMSCKIDQLESDWSFFWKTGSWSDAEEYRQGRFETLRKELKTTLGEEMRDFPA